MSIRKMNGDASIWEDLYWADLSFEEQDLWGTLGWTQEIWDTQKNVPETATMEWKNLTDRQRYAAEDLGFTQKLWDEYEDQ